MASSPFRPKRKETKKSEVKENRVRAAVRRAVRWLRKRFAKNVGKQNSPRVLGAYLAEGQQEDDSLEDLIKQLSSHEKLHAYHLGDVIGHGGYGFVISGTRKADNLPVAMKFVKRSSVLEFIKVEGKPVPSEIYFTNKVKHRYVIKLYQGLTLENYFVYVMERPENCQDLYDVLCNRRLSEKEARRYFSQIVEATICCEENGVVHRDLKLGNILLDKTSDEIKMIDFGLASKMQYEPYHKFRGTKTHMPPEFVRFGWYDGCQSTVWALGIILFNLVSSRMAFNKPEEALERKPRMPVHLSEDAKDLIFSMLNINPFNRPSVKQILKHPWMTVRDPVDDVSSTPIAPAAFNLQSSTSDEEPASCYALAASRSESICITTSFAASKGHDGHNGSERHKDGKLQNARADHKDTMDSENCPLNGKYQGKLNPLRKDKLDRLDRGFRLNTFERQGRTSNQGTFYTQRESNENNKFTQCGCLHDINSTARFPRDIRKRKTRPSSVISIEMDLYHVHWKDKRNAKQGTKIHGKRKPGIEDKKTKWALARQIDKCYYMVEELKARRNMIKLRNFIAGITESGLFPNSLGRNARGRPEWCNTNKYSVRGNKMSFKHVMHEERFTFEPKCRMAITRHADKRGFRHCRKRILKKPP